MIRNTPEARKRKLGMSHGRACHIIRKEMMFLLIKEAGRDMCYRCGEPILQSSDMSFDHKVSWEHSNNPKELFFDLDNIAFSHRLCNALSADRSRSRVVIKPMHNRKLTGDQVVDIWNGVKSGRYSYGRAARKYGVNPRVICRIMNGENYRDVTGKLIKKKIRSIKKKTRRKLRRK